MLHTRFSHIPSLDWNVGIKLTYNANTLGEASAHCTLYTAGCRQWQRRRWRRRRQRRTPQPNFHNSTIHKKEGEGGGQARLFSNSWTWTGRNEKSKPFFLSSSSSSFPSFSSSFDVVRLLSLYWVWVGCVHKTHATFAAIKRAKNQFIIFCSQRVCFSVLYRSRARKSSHEGWDEGEHHHSSLYQFVCVLLLSFSRLLSFKWKFITCCIAYIYTSSLWLEQMPTSSEAAQQHTSHVHTCTTNFSFCCKTTYTESIA